eukprot:scaffold5092_cov179-Amphora_coffeaeformis.AAC.4
MNDDSVNDRGGSVPAVILGAFSISTCSWWRGYRTLMLSSSNMFETMFDQVPKKGRIATVLEVVGADFGFMSNELGTSTSCVRIVDAVGKSFLGEDVCESDLKN